MQGPQFGHHSHQSELRDDGPETELPEMVRSIVSKRFFYCPFYRHFHHLFCRSFCHPFDRSLTVFLTVLRRVVFASFDRHFYRVFNSPSKSPLHTPFARPFYRLFDSPCYRPLDTLVHVFMVPSCSSLIALRDSLRHCRQH